LELLAMSDGTVFLVSADPVASRDMETLVGDGGVEVKPFGSIEEFLKHGDPGGAACLVLDLRLPETSERGPAEPIRAQQVALPLICVTGSRKVALRPTPAAELDVGAERTGLRGLVKKLLAAAAAVLREQSAHSGISSRLLALTPRERQVMGRVVEGASNKMIAYELGISSRTIEIHRAHVMEKTGAESLSDLVRKAFAVGAVGPPEPAEHLRRED
jgi:FixJ family two-component response regulator